MQFNFFAFLLAFAFSSVLVILDIVYTAKTYNSLNANDLPTTKSNFKIAAGLTYFLSAVALISSLSAAMEVGNGKKLLD
jgi:hypothetical protein